MDRLLSHFPHGIAKNKSWPADISSGLLQKMCADNASSDVLLWICSASHGDFTAIDPGKCAMVVLHLSWVWPHSRQCLLVTLSSNALLEQRLHCDPAWCCQVLCCHMQTSQLLWWGTWKPVQDSCIAAPGESPQSTPCPSDQSLDCLLLSELGWSGFWFRPVQVGSSGWPKCVFHEV